MAPQTALIHNVTDIQQHIAPHIKLGSTYLMQPKAKKTKHNLQKNKKMNILESREVNYVVST